MSSPALIRLRIPAPGAAEIASRLVNDLDCDEFSIPGHIHADVAVAEQPKRQDDGSVTMAIEALTVEE